jgi:hypothetical protein
MLTIRGLNLPLVRGAWRTHNSADVGPCSRRTTRRTVEIRVLNLSLAADSLAIHLLHANANDVPPDDVAVGIECFEGHR